MHRGRSRRTWFVLVLIGVLASAASWAQAPSPAVAREIEQLFAALEGSNCAFQRNGTWHGPRKASDHLRRKYDFLLEKGAVASTEVFIELAASRSSMSGKPYLVRCGNTAPIPSGRWFNDRLDSLRKTSTSAQDRRGLASPTAI